MYYESLIFFWYIYIWKNIYIWFDIFIIFIILILNYFIFLKKQHIGYIVLVPALWNDRRPRPVSRWRSSAALSWFPPSVGASAAPYKLSTIVHFQTTAQMTDFSVVDFAPVWRPAFALHRHDLLLSALTPRLQICLNERPLTCVTPNYVQHPRL